jgi:dihydrofolate reductase
MSAQSEAKRRFRYVVSCTIDGFIADVNGGVDFLTEFQGADYGITTFLKEIDTIIYGRTTLFPKSKSGAVEEMPPPARMAGVRSFVLSRTLKEVKGAEVARDPVTLVRELRAGAGKDVWVMGGGDSAAALHEAGGLDEVELSRVPVVLGRGIPLFGKLAGPIRMELKATQAFANGVIRERYVVV